MGCGLLSAPVHNVIQSCPCVVGAGSAAGMEASWSRRVRLYCDAIIAAYQCDPRPLREPLAEQLTEAVPLRGSRRCTNR